MIAHFAQIIFSAIMKFKRKHYSIRWLIDVSIEREHKRYMTLFITTHTIVRETGIKSYTRMGNRQQREEKRLNA